MGPPSGALGQFDVKIFFLLDVDDGFFCNPLLPIGAGSLFSLDSSLLTSALLLLRRGSFFLTFFDCLFGALAVSGAPTSRRQDCLFGSQD